MQYTILPWLDARGDGASWTLSQPVSNEECKVHWAVLKGLRERCANGVDSDRQAFIQRQPSRHGRPTLHYQTMLCRRRQACAAGAWHGLDGVAIVFIPPATLLRNHHLTDTGIFRGILAMQACKVSSLAPAAMSASLVVWVPGQLLPAAGLELVDCQSETTPWRLFQRSRLSATSKKRCHALPLSGEC